MELVSRILAPGVFGAQMSDAGQPVLLHPEEKILVANAAPKRRRDFALGRACARAALAELGYGDAVIGKGESGAPIWPAGVVGSITHTSGYAAAIVAEAERFAGVGVDAERVGGVTETLWPRLFNSSEREQLMALDASSRQVVATLYFSAKEACYKAWALKGALPFRDIHVVQDGDGFAALHAGKRLRGYYGVEGDLLLAVAWL